MRNLRPSHIAKLFNHSNNTLWNIEAYGDNPPQHGFIQKTSGIFKDSLDWMLNQKEFYRRKEFKRYFR